MTLMIKSDKKQSELTVITQAKDLCSYIMTVTQKSPKHFRYTFVTRIQNLALDVIENLFLANDTLVAKGDLAALSERKHFQAKAMTSIRLLCYFSLLASEQQCILLKQYEQIAKLSTDCRNLLGGWINSDKRRFSSPS